MGEVKNMAYWKRKNGVPNFEGDSKEASGFKFLGGKGGNILKNVLNPARMLKKENRPGFMGGPGGEV